MVENQLLTGFVEEIEAHLDRGSLSNSEWIVANFRNPGKPHEAWSFKDHEFQIEIADCGDDVQLVDVQKCAQIGLSTLQIVCSLSFCALHEAKKLIYTLPTAKFSESFSSMRFDPIISGSPRIKMILSPEVNSKALRLIGTSHLLLRGTSGESQAISVDADGIFVDELDFSNARVISTYQSRLQHSLLKLERFFSTPTLPDYGINARAKLGSEARYKVKCLHCNTWQYPLFLKHLTGKGLVRWLGKREKELADVRPSDIDNLLSFLGTSRLSLDDIYLSCPRCKKSLEESLRSPDRRQWVHEHPQIKKYGHRSYYVAPFDVPKYNESWEVFTSMKKYLYGDFVNFRLGLPYASAENSFLTDIIKLYCNNKPIPLDPLLAGSYTIASSSRIYIGCDLGKTSHVAIGIGNGHKLDILCLAQIPQDFLKKRYGEAHMGKFLVELFISIGACKIVVDSMPNYETALYVSSMLPMGMAFGCFYTTRAIGQPDIYKWNDEEGTLKCARTEHFDDFAADFNKGNITLPYLDHEETTTALAHLGNFKKVKSLDSRGNPKETWENTGPDHYTHSVGYAYAAWSSEAKRVVTGGVAAPVEVSTVRVK